MAVEHEVEAQVVAIIPALRRSDRLHRCLDSLLSVGKEHDLRVLCVINGGDGHAPAMTDGRVTFVEAGINLGWPGGLEFGRRGVRAEFLWVVQDDMVMLPGCLDHLLGALERDPTLGAVRPLIVDHRGRVRRRSGGVYLDAAGMPVRGWPMRSRRASTIRIPSDLSYIAGSGMLVRDDAWMDAGGWDWRYYPVQFADADFNARLRAAGWRISLEPQAHARHEVSASSPDHFRALLSFHNGQRYRRRWVDDPDGTAGTDEPPTVHPDVSREQLAEMLVLSNAALFDLDAWLGTQHVQPPVRQRWRGLLWTLRAFVDPRL